jgi:hypothetical protein
MKLYSFYTESHNVLLNEWFLPSLKDNYELVLKKYPQVGDPKQKYGTVEFNRSMLYKVDLIIEAIKENWGSIFIYSDVDVQFFQPTESIILKEIKGKDMVIQRDTWYGKVCAGFFAARGNEKNLRLWQDIRNVLKNRLKDREDQQILNELLLDKASFISIKKQRIINITKKIIYAIERIFNKKRSCLLYNQNGFSNPYDIKWGYLPPIFFSPYYSYRGVFLSFENLWKPGMDIEVPENIIMHHANGTIGIENKIAQFKYVKNIRMRNV